MVDLYGPIVELHDHFSEAVSCTVSIIKNFIDTQKHIKISKRRSCKKRETYAAEELLEGGVYGYFD